MASARGTLVGTIITGLAIGAAVQANVDSIRDSYTGEDRNQQQIITGDLHFATDGSTAPSITLNGTDVITVPVSSTSTIEMKAGGLVRNKELYAQCSATGGLTTYSTCFLAAPFSTTGSLLAASLECGNVVKQLTGDVSFKLTSTSSSGTVLTSLDNIVAGTGALERSAFATEVAWNPANGLSFSTLVSPSGTLNTTRYDCRLWALVSDKYGN
jgi:hypothetical protein